ncbi:iron-containing alcohol dehydrogenase family protein [Nocardioides marmoraquaticus]
MLPSPLVLEVRHGAVADLAQTLDATHISATGDVVVAVGPSQGRRIWETLHDSLPNAVSFVVEDASVTTAAELQDLVTSRGFDAVVGIGGGRVLDVAKYAATRAGVPMVAVATNLAHDGVCSPVASLTHGNGKGSYGVAMPLALLVDLDFVLAAPARLVRAGIGDVLSNLSAVADWQLAHDVRGEPFDGLAAALARNAAESLLRREDTIADDDLLVTLADALSLSGLAMSVAGSSRPCSGACHELLHATDQLFPGTGEHGELAGLGALFATFLRGDEALLARVRATLEHHGLPTLPEHVGLSREQFVTVVEAAPRTRPDRYTILEHLDLGPAAVRDRVADWVDASA